MVKSDLGKLIAQVLEPIRQLNESFNSFLKANPDFFEKLKHYSENFPVYHKDNWVKLAQYGWFLNWETPITVEVALSKNKRYLDNFMSAHLQRSWDNITGKILSSYPERSHILEEAFQLHKEQRYIASIPLFLSQIDGICAQNLKAFLFSEHSKRQDNIQKVIAPSADLLTHVFLEVLNSETQFGASISKNRKAQKELAPNRNGILHGSRKHLELRNSNKQFEDLFSFGIRSLLFRTGKGPIRLRLLEFAKILLLVRQIPK